MWGTTKPFESDKNNKMNRKREEKKKTETKTEKKKRETTSVEGHETSLNQIQQTRKKKAKEKT